MGMLRRFEAAAAVLVALVMLPVMASCTPQPVPGPAPGPEISVPGDPGGTDPGGGDPGVVDPTPSEGPVDPDQPVQQSGLATTFGGPSQGDQGSEILTEDSVCQTVALFWGSEIPKDVTYRIDSGVGADVSGSQPAVAAGLTVEHGPCGEENAVDCLTVTLNAQGEPGRCSVVVRVTPDFHEGAALLFVGTLTCATAEECHAVQTREAREGPAVFVCSPTWLQANPDSSCDADVWKATG